MKPLVLDCFAARPVHCSVGFWHPKKLIKGKTVRRFYLIATFVSFKCAIQRIIDDECLLTSSESLLC